LLLEELSQLKNPMTSSGIEPATFRLNQLCYGVVPRVGWYGLNYLAKRGPVTFSFEHGIEFLRVIKNGEFLDKLSSW
jgi:hypothetical protein